MSWKAHEEWRRRKWAAQDKLFTVFLVVFCCVWPFVILHDTLLSGPMINDEACRTRGGNYYNPLLCTLVVKPANVAITLLVIPVYLPCRYVLLPIYDALFGEVDWQGRPVRRERF